MMNDQAAEPRYLRKWLKKREFLIYYYLFKKYYGREINISDIVNELVSVFNYNYKTAHNITRRLMRLGLIKCRNYRCTVADIFTVLDRFLEGFIKSREKR